MGQKLNSWINKTFNYFVQSEICVSRLINYDLNFCGAKTRMQFVNDSLCKVSQVI